MFVGAVFEFVLGIRQRDRRGAADGCCLSLVNGEVAPCMH